MNEVSTNVNPLTSIIEELTTPEEAQAVAAVSGNSYLPYCSVATGNAKVIQEGKVPAGHIYIMNGDKIIDLGKEANFVLLVGRAKAMTFAPEINSYFDVNSSEFQAVKTRSAKSDSNCGYGPDYLGYLPEENLWFSLFLSSKSGRNAGKEINPLLDANKYFFNMKSDYITSKRNGKSWYIPVFEECDHTLDLPDVNEIREQITKFKKEASSVAAIAEEVDEDEVDTSRD